MGNKIKNVALLAGRRQTTNMSSGVPVLPAINDGTEETDNTETYNTATYNTHNITAKRKYEKLEKKEEEAQDS